MPKTKNRAAAAITGGEEVHYSLESDLTNRYQQYVLRRTVLIEKGSTLKHRLFAARAMECASIMSDLMRHRGMSEDAEFWERRRKQNEAIAFNHKNAIAASIGAGGPAGSDHDDTDQADPDD